MIDITPDQPLDYHWEGHGFKVHIPAGAISEERGPVTLCIQASLSGDYQLPDDGVFVSGVYWLSLYPPVKRFGEKVTLSLKHCASDDDPELSFVTAQCTQKALPYTFKPLEGGYFSKSGSGTIHVDHFSGHGILGRRKALYAICTHYFRKNLPNHFQVRITVTASQPLYRKVNNYFHCCIYIMY